MNDDLHKLARKLTKPTPSIDKFIEQNDTTGAMTIIEHRHLVLELAKAVKTDLELMKRLI